MTTSDPTGFNRELLPLTSQKHPPGLNDQTEVLSAENHVRLSPPVTIAGLLNCLCGHDRISSLTPVLGSFTDESELALRYLNERVNQKRTVLSITGKWHRYNYGIEFFRLHHKSIALVTPAAVVKDAANLTWTRANHVHKRLLRRSEERNRKHSISSHSHGIKHINTYKIERKKEERKVSFNGYRVHKHVGIKHKSVKLSFSDGNHILLIANGKILRETGATPNRTEERQVRCL